MSADPRTPGSKPKLCVGETIALADRSQTLGGECCFSHSALSTPPSRIRVQASRCTVAYWSRGERCIERPTLAHQGVDIAVQSGLLARETIQSCTRSLRRDSRPPGYSVSSLLRQATGLSMNQLFPSFIHAWFLICVQKIVQSYSLPIICECQRGLFMTGGCL